MKCLKIFLWIKMCKCTQHVSIVSWTQWYILQHSISKVILLSCCKLLFYAWFNFKTMKIHSTHYSVLRRVYSYYCQPCPDKGWWYIATYFYLHLGYVMKYFICDSIVEQYRGYALDLDWTKGKSMKLRGIKTNNTMKALTGCPS